MIALSNRAHILAPPEARERLVWCMTTLLGCGAPVTMSLPGLAEPMLAFRFPDGGSMSIEFTDRALDEANVRRGAWFELKTDDPGALARRVVDAGLPRVSAIAPDRFYFALPGGQVLGIVGA